MTLLRSPHLTLSKKYWKDLLIPGDLAIDATCGNGLDTLFLSQCLLHHPTSVIIAMDIQSVALQNTRDLLTRSLPIESLQKVLFHHLGHEWIDQIPLPIPPKLIVYNLGYLPGSDKTCKTQKNTTLQSLEKASTLLAPGGALSVTCYPGHKEGADEQQTVYSFFQSLPSKDWSVCAHQWVNRPLSPSFIWAQRAGV